jgi:asparagine synthase (glutamine-hydrolysing)
MADCLAHRGPDGTSLWRNGGIGMGHLLLATTPESTADRLPLVGGHETFVLTADARIDNRRELASVLGIEKSGDSVCGDDRLILAAYQRWGEQAPEHLVGDFAFAVWDARRQSLFCARDPMGIKPLYYYRSDRFVAFASEIKAVLACPGVPRSVDELKVADHLRWSFDDRQRTFYRGVLRLPAAHSLTVSSRSVSLRRYWNLDGARELRLKSNDEYTEAFRELFVEAVRCRTRSRFPVGSTLSGGLDSSSIACTAGHSLPAELRPLRTFSAVFPTLPPRELRWIDERRYIDAVLKSGEFDHSYVYADRSSPLVDWQRVYGHLDEPTLAPNLYLHWEIYKAAAAKGVRVVLDGLDGDTTVSHGLGRFADLARTGRWLRLVSEAKALSRRYPRGYPFRQVVWRLGFRPLMPERLVQAWRTVRRRPNPQSDVPNLLRREVADRVDAATGPPARSSAFETARQSHWRALSSPLMSYTMELADVASSAFAIEARYPFFDRRLIEFCLSIPAEQKLHDGWTRAIMRRAMEGILPGEVQWRVDKADLSFNFKRTLFERDRRVIEDITTSPVRLLDDYVDRQVLRDTYERWSEQPMRRETDALSLYTATTLALWLGLESRT